jgi:hypothetical protein
MASPYTMYFAGMGTVVAALAVGFSTAVMMTSPLPEQKEQPTGFEKRAAKPEKPAEPAAPPVAERRLDAPVSPLITAIQTPAIATTASAPPASAPQPPPMNQSPQSAAQEPGMLQPPVRPAAPPQTAAAPSTQVTPPAPAAAPVAAPPPAQVIAPQPAQPAIRSREVVRNPDTTGSIDPVTGQWKKKRDYAQKKQRRPIEQTRPAREIEEEEVVETRGTTGVETRSTTGYSSEPRAPAPLGIFNLLLGGGN